MSYFDGRVVAVTGAGAGVGRHLAIQLARQGATLSLIDRDQHALNQTISLIGTQPGVSRMSVVDVSDRDAMHACAAETFDAFGSIDAVFNNAGVLYAGDVLDAEFDDFARVMRTNFWGVVNGSKAFLPYIFRSNKGNIVNVSSAFGLMSAPGYSAYNAAKFAVRGFTESLRQEMLILHPQVKVSCVFPGGIKTSIARTARMAAPIDRQAVIESFEHSIARTEPEKAAQVILRGAKQGRPRILVGSDARIIDVLTRISGSGYQRLIPATNRANRS
ncbi:SDR family NAD(P)-dependent oxidoreductase [Rhodococcus qingshengii]|uniref:SDR family NAD(P)-dependent oxidoreductase n=1 Tax=Rhodococcus qingshengii TaxID=334542 RepID=UPI001BE8D6AB|nr:SDR family oxidoreductase [Rhodococcus qingshengii]MBT2270017.1 SDR family oxidoreductase [Rhodococcus qingshengii]